MNNLVIIAGKIFTKKALESYAASLVLGLAGDYTAKLIKEAIDKYGKKHVTWIQAD